MLIAILDKYAAMWKTQLNVKELRNIIPWIVETHFHARGTAPWKKQTAVLETLISKIYYKNQFLVFSHDLTFTSACMSCASFIHYYIHRDGGMARTNLLCSTINISISVLSKCSWFDKLRCSAMWKCSICTLHALIMQEIGMFVLWKKKS